MDKRAVIALTGGPGGGKTKFIEGLINNPPWSGAFAVLPEVMSYFQNTNIYRREKIFQRGLVNFQMALEDALDHYLGQLNLCRL